MSDIDPRLLEDLGRAVAQDPGDPDFSVFAELLRRAGRLDEAEAVVTEGLLASPDSLAGRCALLLILDDRGHHEQLRGRLEAWTQEAVRERLPGVAPTLSAPGVEEGPDLSEHEFEQAFSSAEPELDAMVTPDSVAEEAALGVDGGYATHSPLEENPAFATQTMAELLERQGDAAGAARIRALLGEPEPEAEDARQEPPERSPSGDLVATLERWLSNAKRLQT